MDLGSTDEQMGASIFRRDGRRTICRKRGNPHRPAKENCNRKRSDGHEKKVVGMCPRLGQLCKTKEEKAPEDRNDTKKWKESENKNIDEINRMSAIEIEGVVSGIRLGDEKKGGDAIMTTYRYNTATAIAPIR